MQTKMDFEFADRITKECLDLYKSLPKKGKPVPDQEWTLLSAIIMALDSKFTVVAMATGTKCLGQNKLSSRGDLVNDSHAEVLTRRCFLRFIYDQISQFKSTGSSKIIIGATDNGQFEINPEMRFHFYTSHVPCGDASIIPKSERRGEKRKIGTPTVERSKIKRLENEQDVNTSNLSTEAYLEDTVANEAKVKSPCEENYLKQCETNFLENRSNKTADSDDECKQSNKSVDLKYETYFEKNEDASDSCGDVIDIHRTGAKCVAGEDMKLPGVLYHSVGAVRTKPGRGDPTLSASCSDKMARWIACGLQGAMLSLLLSRPVLLDSVVVGAGGQYSHTALHRALLYRTSTEHCPRLLQSTIVFPHSRYSTNPEAKPCPSAIFWSHVTYKPLEVAVEGKRQGATKKCRDGGLLTVCKQELLKSFLLLSGDRYRGMTYRSIKESAVQYQNTWAKVKESLGVWTTKPPNLENFKVS